MTELQKLFVGQIVHSWYYDDDRRCWGTDEGVVFCLNCQYPYADFTYILYDGDPNWMMEEVRVTSQIEINDESEIEWLIKQSRS